MVVVRPVSWFAFLLLFLPPLLTIAGGLLVFFLGRRHVRRKYGGK